MPGFIDKLIILSIFLLAHVIISEKGLYYKHPEIDSLPHFLGGVALGAFIKEAFIGIPLVFIWELLEATLAREGRERFHESPLNKLRDLFFSVAGFFIGAAFL